MWMFSDGKVFPEDADNIDLSVAADDWNSTDAESFDLSDASAALTAGLGNSPWARMLSRGWRISLPLFFVWIIVLLYLIFKDLIIPIFTEFKYFFLPFLVPIGNCLGIAFTDDDNWEGNPDYFDSIPLESLEKQVCKEIWAGKEDILEIYKEKLELRKEERKTIMESRRSLQVEDDEPTKDQPKDAEAEPKADDEETGLNDEEDERPSIVEGRMMLVGVLETYNPIANSAYQEYFAEEDVELLRTEMGLPEIKEAGKVDVKAFDKKGDGKDEDDEKKDDEEEGKQTDKEAEDAGADAAAADAEDTAADAIAAAVEGAAE